MADHVPETQSHETGHREPETAHREPEEYSRPSSMSQTTRVVIGLLAFVPLALVIVLLVQVVATAGDPVAAAQATGAPYGTVLVLALLIFFFAAFVFNDRRIPIRAKRLWLAGFILGGPIVIPLYWYLHVLHAPRHSASA